MQCPATSPIMGSCEEGALNTAPQPRPTHVHGQAAPPAQPGCSPDGARMCPCPGHWCPHLHRCYPWRCAHNLWAENSIHFSCAYTVVVLQHSQCTCDLLHSPSWCSYAPVWPAGALSSSLDGAPPPWGCTWYGWASWGRGIGLKGSHSLVELLLSSPWPSLGVF